MKAKHNGEGDKRRYSYISIKVYSILSRNDKPWLNKF